jgi:hypothetical protein
VPKPKMSKPMTRGEMLNILAILAPLSVNASALHISNKKPVRRDKTGSSMLLYRMIMASIIKSSRLEFKKQVH